MSEHTPQERANKAQRRLENRINHWENQLVTRRRSVAATYDHRIDGAATEAQRTHWSGLREEAYAVIDRMEAERLEPMRVEYRALLGLD